MNIKGMGITIGGRQVASAAPAPRPAEPETKAKADIPAGEPKQAPASKKKEQ